MTLDERNLWVVDRADGAADAAGTPLGVLYRLDPQSGALLGETRGVSGGDVASGFGGVWLAAFGFNSVFRVDWGTSAVTRVPTGVDDQGPAGVALAPTGVWVTNHHGGSLVKLDFAHGAVLKTLQLVPPGPDGPSAVAYDGTHLWVAVAGSSQLVELDEATGAATARYAIRAGTCGGLALGEGQVWVAGGECGSTRLSVLELSSGQVKALPIPHAVDAVVAFGSVWVLAGWPARLVRLQPYTYDVLGVMPLPAAGWNLEASADGLWVRVQNALLRVAPS